MAHRLSFFRQMLIGCACAFGAAITPSPSIAASSSSAAREEFPTPAGFTPAFRNAGGVRFHYLRGGSGPLAVLIHGFGQTWYEWHQLMPLLAKTHTVVAIDLPGLGQSTAPASYAGQDVAKQIYTLAKTLSPDRQFDVVAHDIGIWNSYPFAVEHQGDIRRLVFMEAPIPDASIYDWPAFTPQGSSPVWHFSFFALDNQFPEQLLKGKESTFLSYFILHNAVNKTVFTPDLLALYSRSYAKPGILHGAFEYYRALNETVRRNQSLALTKLAMPVLAIGGSHSMGQLQGDQTRKYATNVRAEVLEGCGHWLPEECAKTLNPMIAEFLEPSL